MKKTKILKLMCATLAALMLAFHVCTAVNLPDMSDPIESVVRLGKFSSKIDPTIPFDEGCVVVYLNKPNGAETPYNKLTVADLPFLEIESVEYVPTPRDYKAPDIYLLHLKNHGRREVAEAIIALENNYENVEALKHLPENMTVPCPAISPKYDYLDLEGKFTRNLYNDRYYFHNIPGGQPIYQFSVRFKEKQHAYPDEFAETLFPEIASKIEKVRMWDGYTDCTVYLKSVDDLIPRPETLEEQWMRTYRAISALNQRTDDIERIDVPDFQIYSEPPSWETYVISDYGRNDWFSSAVGYVRTWGLMNSESIRIKGPVTIKNEYTGEEKVVEESKDVYIYNVNFYPEMGMTRAMLVTVLYRMAGYPYTPNAQYFDDVPEDQWYSKAVMWAHQNDIVEGVGDWNFAPDREITREEFVTIMYRYHTEWNDSPVRYRANYFNFADGREVSDWARNGMAWAVGNLLIEGRDGNLIAPTATITRAEAAKIIMRYDDYTPKK